MKKSIIITILMISLFLSSSLTINAGVEPGDEQIVFSSSFNNNIQSDARVDLGGKPLHVTFVWHQHQPSYLDPTTGYYEQPWVFMHAINDYPFMAKLMIDRPTINATMDITGTLLRQLVDYSAHTAKDRLIEMVLKNNADLTDDEKYFLFGPFPGGNLFDINGQFLVNKFLTVDKLRSDYLTWTDNEMNAAKTLFFLKWMNRVYVDANVTLSALRDKNLDPSVDVTPYTQADVNYTVAAGYDILESVIPIHKQLVDNGQLELVTTPLAHPIGPLLLDTRSELETSDGKATKMPINNTVWPEDFDEQIRRSNELFFDQFGSYPKGIWSPEQAVSPAIISHYVDAGIEWSITAPEQLAKVPGRTSTETDLNQLYRVENTDKSANMYFVYDDTELSDAVGFQYASFANQTEAVEDFMDVLYRKYQTFKDEAGDPRLASLGMDGENAWEWYPDNAIQFREELYDEIVKAQNDGWLVTTTVSKYKGAYGAIPIDHTLTTGSWINGDFTTWIGEDLENRYWDELIDARTYLVSVNDTLNATAVANAWDSIYLAEGSDWFWWAGADQDSGNDEKFDWAFKSLLRDVYHWTGKTDAQILAQKPFLFEQLKPLSSFERDPSGVSEITIDGVETLVDEWDATGWFRDPDGGTTETGTAPANVLGEMYIGYGAPETDLFVRIDLSDHITAGTTWNNIFLSVYISGDGEVPTNIRTRYGNSTTISPGFPIAYEIGVNITELVAGVQTNVSIFSANGDETYSATNVSAIVAFDGVLEFAIPVIGLNAGPESTLLFGFEAAASNTTLDSMYAVDFASNDGPMRLTLPPAGVSGDLIFTHVDEIGDETGSAGPVGSTGGLQYGQNAAFDPYQGLFDLTGLSVYHDPVKEETIFEVGILTITNPWGSPYGLSQPGILVYIDQDRTPGSGGTVGIEASSADVDEFSAYEFAFQAGGWEVSWNFYSPVLNEDGYPTATAASAGVNMRMVVDPNEGFVRITIADSAIGFVVDDSMGFIVATVSNDGFSPNNIRQTAESAAEYKMGGQSDSSADPNIIDTLTPPLVDQLAMLSNYKEAPETHAKLTVVGVDVDGIYDFIPPQITSMLFNGHETIAKTNTETGAIVNASFTVVDESPVGGVWVFDSSDHLIGVAGKEVSFVEFFLLEGTHDVEIRIADSIGNIAIESYTIIVTDGFAPKIISIGVDPNPPVPDSFVSMTAVVTDAHLQTVVARYSTAAIATFDSTYEETALSIDSAVENGWKGLIAKFSEGDTVIFQIVAFDEAGNVGESELLEIEIKAPVDPSDTEETPLQLFMVIVALIAIPLRRKFNR